MTPTLFRYKQYAFFFFSREEKRIHVHVRSAEGEAKFWIEPRVMLCRNAGLSPKQVNECLKVVEEHRDEIVAAWKSHFKG